MHLRGRSFLAICVLLFLAIAAVPWATLRAQSNDIYVTLAVSTQSRDIYTDQMISAFETAHPGVKVNIIKYDANIPLPANGLDAYFTGLQAYANVADVLSVDARRTLTPAATSAGYYLDLGPLATSDKSVNVDDFYPAVWQSFQWDKGMWGLPTSTDALIMSYDPAAFDKAGIAKPSEKWTLDDLVNAATKLTVKDGQGKVTTAGLSVLPGNDAALFRSLLGENLFDASAVPSQPQLDKPTTEALLDAWHQLQTNGNISTSFNDFQTAPISIGSVSAFIRLPTDNSQRVGLLLPGGKSGLTVQGFAVSAGTQHPEQAFALANFLTTRPELGTRGGISPARKSLVGAQVSGGGGPGGGRRNRNLTPETQKLIDDALANGISTADLRFADYLDVALNQMKTSNVSAKDALQAVEAQAVQDLQAAVTKKQTVALNVAAPAPTPTLAPGKVAIKFSMTSFVSPMPNQDKWDAVIKEFTSTDPQVGAVNFDTSPRFGALDTTVNNFDCFYLPYNAVPSANLGLLMNIDPYLSADSSFDKNDVVGNIMAQLQRDNKTWGLPIVIQPTILKYNSAQFNKVGLPEPVGGWTIDAFSADVKALKPNTTDPAPFLATNTAGSHLLIFIAAYGGLPLDYRTNPPSIDFISQANVDAIRQVLDLARSGYINYSALSNLDFGGGQNNLQTAIYTSNLNAFNRRPQTAANGIDVYKDTSYPTGPNYSALSYSIGTAYISAKSQNPEACYRWLSAISRHPELFSAMPARSSLINDPKISATQGPDVTAMYNAVDKILKNPNTLSVPAFAGGGGAPTTFLLQHWLFEAFDNYVLNNADLQSSLKDDEAFAKAFLACAQKIPPFDPTTQNQRDYNQQYASCATTVDPRLKTLFGG